MDPDESSNRIINGSTYADNAQGCASQVGLGNYDEGYTYDPATGNLDLKAGVDLNYNDAAHVHAVTNAGSNTYTYDANGNQTKRVVDGQIMALEYDAENRLVKVCEDTSNDGVCDTGETVKAEFIYDGDGRRVKSIMGNEIILFVGGHYEINDMTDEVTKYYFAGTTRVAMRKYTIPSTMAVEYFLGDHLGSTSITTDANGAKVSEMRYKPWGEVRSWWTDELLTTTPAYKLAEYSFTGQFSHMDDPSTTEVTEGFGLMFYVSRMYDPALGRFIQADSIIPPGVQGLDRYAYVNNSPINYVDPSGHIPICDSTDRNCDGKDDDTTSIDLPDQVETDELTRGKGITGLGGLDVYYAYLSMWFDKDGWWWSYFGQDGTFTIWDMFASIAIHETQGNWTDPNLSEAAIRDANGWCVFISGQSCTAEGYINHFAWEYQSGGNYLGSQFPEPNYVSWNDDALKGMQDFSSDFANHPSDWDNGCAWDRPCGWANKSMYSIDVQKVISSNQKAVFTYYDPNGDTWIIPSQCVYVQWMGGGAPSMVNLEASCPIVR